MKQTLTIQQHELIIGTLLGDGNLQTETQGRSWRYRAIQKAEHKEYLFFKYDILKSYCTTVPIYNKILDERTLKHYEHYYFNTIVDKSFRFYGNLFYKWNNEKNKFIKLIPKNIEKFLTPAIIAYWYMDDGALKWLGKFNAMRICTDSFTLLCVKRLQKALKNKFNIETNIIIKKKNKIIVGYRLYINEKNAESFRNLIKPFLIQCMYYKVSDGFKNHL